MLLYGFGPYRQFAENITAKIIDSLPPAAGFERVIFPVRFHRGQFVQAIQQHSPEVILGLGQSRRRHMELEARAINRRRARPTAPGRPIRAHGPLWLEATTRLRRNRALRRSTYAGDYVCNFSLYILLDAIRREELPIECGFVHIPHDFPIRKATRAVEAMVRQLRRRQPPSNTSR